MNNYSDKWIEELKSKVDIVKVIQDFILLNKKGKNYWACCPFHSDKTASFSVNEQQQFYHCFGCHKAGDAIKFMREYQNLSFSEAIEYLAKKFGVKIPETEDDPETAKRKRIFAKLTEVNKAAAEYYYNSLFSKEGEVAFNYLRNRGISDASIVKFGLGYSPSLDGLFNYLQALGYSEKTMREAGLINEKSTTDFLSFRLIVPIININGNVLGFGGRILEKGVDSKYKNTAQTIVFDKRENLFGINIIKKLRKEREEINSLILVEGYMDVITLNQAGITNVIASMGTSLTIEQCKAISKNKIYTVYVCYDGDGAGKMATWRSLDMLASANLEVRVISIPDNLDPDDYVRKYGADEFKKLIDYALPLIEYKIRKIAVKYDLGKYDGKEKFTNEALLVLEPLDKITQTIYAELIAKLANIPKEAIFNKLNVNNKSDNKLEIVPENKALNPVINDPLPEARRFILAAWFMGLTFLKRQDLKEIYFIKDSIHWQIFKYIETKIQENKLPIFGDLLFENTEMEEEIIKIESKMMEIDSDTKTNVKYYECIKKLEEKYIDNEIDLLTQKIKSEKDSAKKTDIYQELTNLLKNKEKL